MSKLSKVFFLDFALFSNSIYGYFIYIKSTRILKDIFYTLPCIIFYTQNELLDLIEKNGFSNVEYRNLSNGISAIHSGWKI